MSPISRRQTLLAIVSTLGLAACGRKPVRGQPVAAGATVLALGDSLTHGSGATPETNCPAVLARLTGWNAVNAGVPGHMAAQALESTQALLDEHKPALVLLCIGGNDLLRRGDEAAAKATIERADAIHANAAGCERFAQGLLATLRGGGLLHS